MKKDDTCEIFTITCVGEMRNAFKILVKTLQGGDHLGDLSTGLYERLILKLILKNNVKWCGLCMAQRRVHWRDSVNTATKRAAIKFGEFL
jgi:hypothetical protein